ncbi:MAG: hypothetical protein AMXMBFR48_05800 [Ignavibacteriales bacterium]
MSRALGLIETKGLVGAIEAADAMVKAAAVTIVGKEKTVPAMITIQIAGEVAAVRSAIDAGAAAASRVGQLISVHIIPQPDDQMDVIIPQLFNEPEIPPVKHSSVKTPQPKDEQVKSPKTGKPHHVETVVPEKDSESEATHISEEPAEPVTFVRVESTSPEVSTSLPAEAELPSAEPEVIPEEKIIQNHPPENSEITGESLFDNELLTADDSVDSEPPAEIVEEESASVSASESDTFDDVTEKMFEDLPDNFSLMDSDIYSLNVHQLRKLARQIDNFPIQGREISKANRNELLRHFEALRSP